MMHLRTFILIIAASIKQQKKKTSVFTPGCIKPSLYVMMVLSDKTKPFPAHSSTQTDNNQVHLVQEDIRDNLGLWDLLLQVSDWPTNIFTFLSSPK